MTAGCEPDRRRDGAGAAGQRLPFHAALEGPDEPRLARGGGRAHEIGVGPGGSQRRMAPQLAPTSLHVHTGHVVHQHHEVRHADEAEEQLALARLARDGGHRARQLEVAEADLGEVGVTDAARGDGAGIGGQRQRTAGQAHARGEARAAEGRVAAHRRPGAVGVVEVHAHRVRTVGGQQHQPVGAHTSPAVADGDDPFHRPLGEPVRPPVEDDEVVARPRHLVDRRAHLSLPKRDSMRSHQTIHTASRTIFLLILLCPSTRSVKTIGTSVRRNPFFHARKLISIWKA